MRVTDRRTSGMAVYLVLTAAMALFGSAFTASKILADTLPPAVAAALRFGCGALVLLIWLGVTGRGFGLPARDWPRILLAGALGIFAFNWLFFWGLHQSPSVDGSILVPVLSPVLTTAVSALFLHETASPARIAGLTVGVGGAVLFLLGVDGPASGERLIGDLAYVAGAGVWTAYTLLGRRILAGIDPLKATALTMSAGSLMLVLAAAPALPSVAWSDLSAGIWLDIAYLGVFPTAIAYVAYFHGIRSMGPARASIMMLLVPVFGATGGLVVLHESLTLVQYAGGALMLAGALLAVARDAFAAPARPSRRGGEPVPPKRSVRR
ncbi:EamA family transporter [Nonomuraea sp. NPDC048916]|uniref:DMT family transporter n=1 Tax=Nonomuraea sp. NPDC048916 TaxID=3154232 RepID=UPI0033E87281